MHFPVNHLDGGGIARRPSWPEGCYIGLYAVTGRDDGVSTRPRLRSLCVVNGKVGDYTEPVIDPGDLSADDWITAEQPQ